MQISIASRTMLPFMNIVFPDVKSFKNISEFVTFAGLVDPKNSEKPFPY